MRPSGRFPFRWCFRSWSWSRPRGSPLRSWSVFQLGQRRPCLRPVHPSLGLLAPSALSVRRIHFPATVSLRDSRSEVSRSPRRQVPPWLRSACVVSRDLDGLLLSGPGDLFQPLTPMGFGLPFPRFDAVLLWSLDLRFPARGMSTAAKDSRLGGFFAWRRWRLPARYRSTARCCSALAGRFRRPPLQSPKCLVRLRLPVASTVRPSAFRSLPARFRGASLGSLRRFSGPGCPGPVTTSLRRSFARWPVRPAPPGSPSASLSPGRLPLCRGCLSRCLVDHWPRVNSSCGRFPSGAVPPPRRMDRSRSRPSPLSRWRPLASAGFAFFPPSVAARGLLRTVG